jgi:hypothetical protein
MTTTEAMNEVSGYLISGEIACAQCAVLAIEGNDSVLPSSVIERVLLRAIQTDNLLPQYREFCERGLGRKYVALLQMNAS